MTCPNCNGSNIITIVQVTVKTKNKPFSFLQKIFSLITFKHLHLKKTKFKNQKIAICQDCFYRFPINRQ